jgi:cell division protein FtsN
MVARRNGGRRTGTFLVLVGIVGILATTFLAGVWTGRNWPLLTGAARPAGEPAGKARAAAERPRPSQTLPPLTFYRELTAPLTAPPPPAKPGKAPRPPDLVRHDVASEPRHEAAAEPLPARVETPSAAPSPASEASPARAETPTAGGFTVQVAAYNARPPAEALRATLVAAGHDARVVEAVTGTGVRYRVQVGVFPSRQAAQDAAGRLTAERALSTFVTTR